MIVPFFTLASLVVLIPAFAMLDSVGMIGAASAILAATLMVISIALPVASLARFAGMLRPFFILVLAAPALWMLLQITPMPAGVLVNPIWASASAALNQRLSGTITVDVGATLLSLAHYCAVVAAALVTTAIALDRQRAMQILYILTAIVALAAAWQIALAPALFDRQSLDGNAPAQFSVIAVVGILLSCGTAIQAIDQLQRTGRSRRSRGWAIFALSGAVLSLFICASAIAVRANPAVAIAALLGAGMLFAVFAIRQWLLGPWGAAGLAAAAAIGAFGVFAAIPVDTNVDRAIAFSTQNQTAIERMLSDVAPAGSGAGTFTALLPFYQEAGAAGASAHPTAAAAIMIEMGPAFFCCLIIAALFGAWTLFSRSLARGQDYVYSAAGAGALMSLPIMALTNGGILNLGASLLAGVVCGLAFGQSLGRAAGGVMSFKPEQASEELGRPRRKRPSARSLSFDRKWPRVALALFGLVLTAQAAWILCAEGYSADHFRLSTVESSVASDAARSQIGKAAAIAAVRGDLWAESAFALIAQSWTGPADGLERDIQPALNAFTRVLRYSPHRGDVWLMLAALAERYRPAGYDTGGLLRMSYYTAPNELDLIPLRLHVALGANTVPREPELCEMIKRDISLALNRHPALKPALATAYNSASTAGKIFAEQLLSETDPAYLETIRGQ